MIERLDSRFLTWYANLAMLWVRTTFTSSLRLLQLLTVLDVIITCIAFSLHISVVSALMIVMPIWFYLLHNTPSMYSLSSFLGLIYVGNQIFATGWLIANFNLYGLSVYLSCFLLLLLFYGVRVSDIDPPSRKLVDA